MILQALTRYYEVLAQKGLVAVRNWSTAPVSDRLVLDRDGSLIGIVSAKVDVQKGKKTVQVNSPIRVPEQAKRSSAITPNFLCDSASYLLGISPKGEKLSHSNDAVNRKKGEKAVQRAVKCFEASRKFHHTMLARCHSEAADAIRSFFRTWNPAAAKSNPIIQFNWNELSEAGNLIFQINGRDAQEDTELKEAWNDYKATRLAAAKRGQCLVTGKKDVPIAILHPNIKGVRDAQSSGAALVSFNSRAFESYGHAEEQGMNAPVGEEAAFAYTMALNYLLHSDHVLHMDGTTVVFWAEHGEDSYPSLVQMYLDAGKAMDDPSLKEALVQIARGIPVNLNGIQIQPDEPFYILGVAPNAARLSIRFFYRNTFGETIQHLQNHQNRMELAGPPWETESVVTIQKILQETANPHSSDSASSPLLAGSLFRAVLHDAPYPEAVYRNILLRVFCDQDSKKGDTKKVQKVTFTKVAFIKAYLLKDCKKGWVKEITMTVNENCNEIAYVLGRMFAVLENLQKSANPELTTTIKDRYFNAACATPSVVFPALWKLANAHLAKLDEKLQVYYKKKLGALMEKITMPDQGTPMPSRLNLDEQGMFVLGYYQEMQARFTKKEDKE